MYSLRCLALCSLTALAAACSRPAPPAASAPAAGFTLTAAMRRDIQLDTVRREAPETVLTLSGQVTTNDDQTVQVFPLVGGIVQELKVELGDHVQKGQVLAVIRSGEIADLQNQQSAALTDLATAQKNLAVLQDQYRVGLAAERDVALARQDLSKARSTARKARKQLAIYSLTPDGLYSLRAPIAGFITDKRVTQGMQFNDDNVGALFTIADLDDVWVLANVFESDIARVREGYPADVSLLAYPDKIYHGHLDRVFNVLDPTAKVMKVRVQLHNPGYAIKPEMYATVRVRHTEAGQRLTVPAAALIFDKGAHFVVVYRDAHHLAVRPVQVLSTDGERATLADGVRPGEVVVTRNQLLLYDALDSRPAAAPLASAAHPVSGPTAASATRQ